ncbi:MAG: hypothetical protein R2838_24605 [Caldilineaceae bacterium]
MTWGDINNDGKPELFATDMKPYADDPRSWPHAPLMAGMSEEMPWRATRRSWRTCPCLLRRQPGRDWGVDGTGWSWSAKFGDLDQDGLLDLYVVNGMAEETMFAHLPDHELVEENQALRNTGDGFTPMATWGLNATAGGRAEHGRLGRRRRSGHRRPNLRACHALRESTFSAAALRVVKLAQPGVQNRDAVGARRSAHRQRTLHP